MSCRTMFDHINSYKNDAATVKRKNRNEKGKQKNKRPSPPPATSPSVTIVDGILPAVTDKEVEVETSRNQKAEAGVVNL